MQENIRVNLTHRVKTLAVSSCISKLILITYKIYVSGMQNGLSIQFIKRITNTYGHLKGDRKILNKFCLQTPLK